MAARRFHREINGLFDSMKRDRPLPGRRHGALARAKSRDTAVRHNSSAGKFQYGPAIAVNQTCATPNQLNDMRRMWPDVFSTLPHHFEDDTRNPCLLRRGKRVCLPYFYLIGATKSGTTDMYWKLMAHPEIRPPMKAGCQLGQNDTWASCGSKSELRPKGAVGKKTCSCIKELHWWNKAFRDSTSTFESYTSNFNALAQILNHHPETVTGDFTPMVHSNFIRGFKTTHAFHLPQILYAVNP
ncbi:hypothetical protein CYMTET_51991, partial [Cymbomonas tetramitiformis]